MSTVNPSNVAPGEVVNEASEESAWDRLRTETVGGVPLQAFVKAGRLMRVSTERWSTVVGGGNNINTVHHQRAVYELDLGDGGITTVYPLNPGRVPPAPGTRFRVLCVGRAGSFEGTLASMTAPNGYRYSLAADDELARGYMWVPKFGPPFFWTMVCTLMLAGIYQIPWYEAPRVLLAVLPLMGLAIAVPFLARHVRVSGAMQRFVQRCEDHWRGNRSDRIGVAVHATLFRMP